MFKIVLRFRDPDHSDLVFHVPENHPALDESVVTHEGKTFIYQNDQQPSNVAVFYQIVEPYLDISNLVPVKE